MDMAKEICIIQRNEKGRQVREYFRDPERTWNSTEKVMAQAFKIADRKIPCLEVERKSNRPKVLFADGVAVSKNAILIGSRQSSSARTGCTLVKTASLQNSAAPVASSTAPGQTTTYRAASPPRN